MVASRNSTMQCFILYKLLSQLHFQAVRIICGQLAGIKMDVTNEDFVSWNTTIWLYILIFSIIVHPGGKWCLSRTNNILPNLMMLHWSYLHIFVLSIWRYDPLSGRLPIGLYWQLVSLPNGQRVPIAIDVLVVLNSRLPQKYQRTFLSTYRLHGRNS